jgi:hypothetical protein
VASRTPPRRVRDEPDTERGIPAFSLDHPKNGRDFSAFTDTASQFAACGYDLLDVLEKHGRFSQIQPLAGGRMLQVVTGTPRGLVLGERVWGSC